MPHTELILDKGTHHLPKGGGGASHTEQGGQSLAGGRPGAGTTPRAIVFHYHSYHSEATLEREMLVNSRNSLPAQGPKGQQGRRGDGGRA